MSLLLLLLLVYLFYFCARDWTTTTTSSTKCFPSMFCSSITLSLYSTFIIAIIYRKIVFKDTTLRKGVDHQGTIDCDASGPPFGLLDGLILTIDNEVLLIVIIINRLYATYFTILHIKQISYHKIQLFEITFSTVTFLEFDKTTWNSVSQSFRHNSKVRWLSWRLIFSNFKIQLKKWKLLSPESTIKVQSIMKSKKSR